MQDLQQACEWGTFRKLELGIEYHAGSITVGAERRNCFLHKLNYQKMPFSKPGKYSIINLFGQFFYLYVKLLNFESFLHNSQQLFFQEKKKKQNSVKTRKITCLLTCNKYLHQLPWVDCANVELFQKKKEFQYQDVFYIKP